MAARLLGWHWRLRFAACVGGALRAGGAAGVSDGGSIRGAAGHQQAEVLLGNRGRAERDDPALVHDGDTVGQGVDLVEFGRDDHHRHALVPLGHQAFVHELDRADVQAAGRLADDHQLDVPAHLPGDHDLLLVATGQRPGRRGGGLGPHVVLLDALDRRFLDRVEVQCDTGGIRRLVVDVEYEVVGDREVSHQAVLGTVLGDIADARVEPAAGRGVTQVGAVKQYRAGRGPQAHQRLAQLGLAVPLDAGHTQDLAGPHLEGHVAHRLLAALPRHAQVLDIEHHIAGLGRLLAHPQLDRPADHQRGELHRGGGRRPLADDLAAPDDRDVVGDRLHLFELVRDEDDRPPALPQFAHDPEQVLGLAGGQHGGGLVEYQNLGVTEQRLDDLDPLLHADRQFFHYGVGIHAQAEPLGQREYLTAGPAPVEQAEGGQAERSLAHRLAAEGDVLGHGEDRHQHEVLVHHADLGPDRVPGRIDHDRFVVEQDLALVGLHQPVEHVHQRGLASAVFPQQGADLARLDDQVDVVVGDQAPEALRDAAQLKFHRQPPSSRFWSVPPAVAGDTDQLDGNFSPGSLATQGSWSAERSCRR